MEYLDAGDYLLTDTGMVIPKDLGNRDYQMYLESLPITPCTPPTPYEVAIEKRVEYEAIQLVTSPE